jgi:hypothetical protein
MGYSRRTQNMVGKLIPSFNKQQSLLILLTSSAEQLILPRMRQLPLLGSH